MTPRYDVSPAATDDLEDMARYLGRAAGPDIAFRFQESAAKTFDELARMPGLGEIRETDHPQVMGLRVRPIGGFPNHLVFYRPVEDGIVVVRVLHGARNIDRILESGDV